MGDLPIRSFLVGSLPPRNHQCTSRFTPTIRNQLLILFGSLQPNEHPKLHYITCMRLPLGVLAILYKPEVYSIISFNPKNQTRTYMAQIWCQIPSASGIARAKEGRKFFCLFIKASRSPVSGTGHEVDLKKLQFLVGI